MVELPIHTVINPLKDLFKREFAVTILFDVIFFKLGDAILLSIASPLYIELGYSKSEIAVIVKLYGLIATLVGGFVGGMVMYRFNNFKGLIITGIIQSFNAFCVYLAQQSVSFFWSFVHYYYYRKFFCRYGYYCCGCGYISYLCNNKYSATQYALFTAASSLCNDTFTIYAGKLVNMASLWNGVVIFTIILALPT